jgi:hypothetical protein
LRIKHKHKISILPVATWFLQAKAEKNSSRGWHIGAYETRQQTLCEQPDGPRRIVIGHLHLAPALLFADKGLSVAASD